uniref:Methyltransferase domain-containing protein n=1 Tax=Amblyomma parvum TaxID=251391 RepID=A0A023FV72_AMBPA
MSGAFTEQRRRRLGIAAIALTGCSAVGIVAVAVPFLSPALRKVCLPYVPATDIQVRNVAAVLRKRSQRSALVDLGSGDGRIVFEAAKLGFTPSVGVELNPWLVAYSKIRALASGASPRPQFVRTDLWKFSLAPFDNVVVFGVEQMMAPLERKLVTELKPGSWVLACRFPLPTLKPVDTCGDGIDTVWLYRLTLQQHSRPVETHA